MKTRTLDDWLDFQQRVHPRSIELGLDRVREVWQRMGAPTLAPVIITVGGTNGKGSTVAFLEAMLRAAGLRVGCYTSPHLLRYNERVRLNGADVDDALLVDAFERIEAARTQAAGTAVPLTYFEYGTLAAFWIFAHGQLDAAVLEVGLGGRLDAVNLIDADAAIVTTVDLDHQDWLGNDRDSIGREKAGIFRRGRPGIIGTTEPPHGLLQEAGRIGTAVVCAGRDYAVERRPGDWHWRCGDAVLDMPQPALAAPCQIDNAAAALTALYVLRDRLPWEPVAWARGVRAASARARLQRFTTENGSALIVDVAHNPQAARVLAHWLRDTPIVGRTFAVFGALDDKDIAGIIAPLRSCIDCWLLAALDTVSPRGMSLERLRAVFDAVAAGAASEPFADPAAALSRALGAAGRDDRIIAFGSFFIAGAALESMRAAG